MKVSLVLSLTKTNSFSAALLLLITGCQSATYPIARIEALENPPLLVRADLQLESTKVDLLTNTVEPTVAEQRPQGPIDAEPSSLADALGADESSSVEMSGAGVTLKRSNIRLGPGREHEIIDTLAAGEPLLISAKTANDWLLIQRAGEPFGYIAGFLVRLAP